MGHGAAPLPALKGCLVKHRSQVFELGHDSVHESDAGICSASTGLEDHARSRLPVEPPNWCYRIWQAHRSLLAISVLRLPSILGHSTPCNVGPLRGARIAGPIRGNRRVRAIRFVPIVEFACDLANALLASRPRFSMTTQLPSVQQTGSVKSLTVGRYAGESQKPSGRPYWRSAGRTTRRIFR
jgi:hypothetical protein